MVLSLYFAIDSKDKIACTSLIRLQMQLYVPIPNVQFFLYLKKHSASYDVVYIN